MELKEQKVRELMIKIEIDDVTVSKSSRSSSKRRSLFQRI